MKSFIEQPEIKYTVDNDKIDRFIDVFNENIKKHKLHINDVLDGFDRLNKLEFEEVKRQAYKNGYEFTELADNYQSTSYKLTPIKSV